MGPAALRRGAGLSDPVLRRALANSGWLLGANALTALCGFGQSILLTQALGVQGFGTFSLVGTFVVVLNRLTSFRMNEFVVKYVTDARAAGADAEAAGAIKLSLLIEGGASVVAFLVVFGLAPLAGSLFLHDRSSAYLIQIYAFVVLATIIAETSAGVLQVFNEFRLQSTLNVAGAALLLLAFAVGYQLDATITGMLTAGVIGNFASAALVSVAALRLAGRQLGPGWWRVSLGNVWARWGPPIRFALSTNASASLTLVTRDADPLWLSLFRGSTEVGYYRLGFTLTGYAMIPVSQLVQSFYPEIVRKAAHREWQAFRHLLRKGSFVAAAYLVPLGVGVMLLGRTLVRLVYGPAFEPAADVLMILFLGMGFSNLLFWNRPALLALGRADYPLKVNLVLAGLKVIGILLIIPRYGYTGTAALLAALYLIGVSLSVMKIFSELHHRHAALG